MKRLRFVLAVALIALFGAGIHSASAQTSGVASTGGDPAISLPEPFRYIAQDPVVVYASLAALVLPFVISLLVRPQWDPSFKLVAAAVLYIAVSAGAYFVEKYSGSEFVVVLLSIASGGSVIFKLNQGGFQALQEHGNR